MNKDKFENWLSGMKRYVEDGSVKKYLPQVISFLEYEAIKIYDSGLLSLEDALDCTEYKELIFIVGKDTGFVKRMIKIICMGVFCDDCQDIWENFILYTIDKSERELCVFLLDGFYHMLDSMASFNQFKYSFIGMEKN